MSDHDCTVVLVEDEWAVLRVVQRLLAVAGYTVLAFDNPLGANDFLRTAAAPCLLITDVVMPGMSGFELCDAVRTRFPDLPVIFTSGYALENLPGYASKLPENSRLIVKPFGFDRVRDTIEELLQPASRSDYLLRITSANPAAVATR